MSSDTTIDKDPPALCAECQVGYHAPFQRFLRLAVREDGPTFLMRCSVCGSLWHETLRGAKQVTRMEALSLYPTSARETDQDKSPDAFIQAMQERRSEPSRRRASLPEDLASRGLGLCLLLFGAFLFWFDTYMPIIHARAHVPELRSKYFGENRLVFVQPILFILGVAYTLYGEKCSKILGPTARPSALGWALAAVGTALGFAYVHYFNMYLQAL